MVNPITDLLPYQQDAVNKLKQLKVGALFMEQGTGKTRTALSLIGPRLAAGKVDCVLWLCPCSVKRNLREDLIFHCGGMPEEIVIRGIESLSSSDRLYMQLMKLVETHKVFLIVDESSLTKNKMAIRTSRIVELSKHCKYKLILNGTPISKNEADLFAQWYILDWRILGYQSYYSFAANHLEYKTIRLPDGREIVDKSRVVRVLNIDYLTEKIAPYTYQIKKDECLKLPRKIYREELFYMTDDQHMEYAEVEERYLEAVDEIRSDTIYKLFSACQHVTSGMHVLSGPDDIMSTSPMFTDPLKNPRIQALLNVIKDIKDEKAIIFCKYQHEVNDILSILPNAIEFTGHVSQKRRQENRELFRSSGQFLVANKSCGAFGLNLQFCHNVIFYNNDFDLATRLQAEDRVHRLGQKSVVKIWDIECRRSIDTFITDCLSRKENVAEAFKRLVKIEQEGETDWRKSIGKRMYTTPPVEGSGSSSMNSKR